MGQDMCNGFSFLTAGVTIVSENIVSYEVVFWEILKQL